MVLLSIAARWATLTSFLTELMKTRNLASRGHTGAHPTEGHLDPPTTPEEMAKYHHFQGAESEEQSQVSWPR